MKEKKGTLKNREIFAYACTSVVPMGSILVTSFISGYWTDVVGISIAVVGMIMLLSRIFDGVSDIIMGLIIDKTHTKYGKAKPWLLIGAVGVMVTSTFIFNTPNIAMTGKIVYAGVMYCLIFAVFGTMTGVACPTLINLMTTDQNDRFKMGSWYFSMMFLASMILGFGLNVITALGGGQSAYFKVALLCNVVAALLMVYVWCTIKERQGQEVLEKQKKVTVKDFLTTIFRNKFFLLVTAMYLVTNISSGVVGGAMYYYVMYVMQNPTAFGVLSMASYGACVLGTLVAPTIGNKVGVTKLVIISNLLTAAAYFIILINPSNLMWVAVWMTIGSFTNGPACAVLAPYNAMAADYGEYKTGVARPAVYSAGTSVGTKVGVGLGGVLFSFLLAFAGYDGMAEIQPTTALTCMTFSYIVIPAICMLVNNILTVPFFKLERQTEEISKTLAERHSRTE